MKVLAKSRKMNSLMKVVDEKSRQIITYLMRERHAGIRKLANLISASSDMEVLIRIREVINPKAREIIGEPLITFERAKIDPLTGEKIVFSWWLKEELMDGVCNDGLLEIIDEKNVLRVIASLPPQEENIEVEVKDDFLIISGKEYYKELPLFCPVEKSVRKTFNNGVLEVRLNKVE
ncbi:MAG: Hsp20/alpha crystallin family protein [Candidatus Bathyarchaeota archaeon]|nr:Hsp20/alpha crystallin family protein [Candidatus Bathyarchaeota archaeon]